MKKVISIITSIAISLAMTSAFAAGTANHTVTVTVEAINEMTLTGGNITLTVNSAVAGNEPDVKSDATTSLDWTTNETAKKITVATSLAAPKFALAVEATTVTGGTTAGSVTLTDVAQDFVTGVATTTGGATLSYSATATASDGTGSEANVVTYTITASA